MQKRCRDKIWGRILEAYGGQCACCGEREAAFLQLDHVSGIVPDDQRRPGWSSRRLTGTALYRAVLRAGCPPDYQLLCANCNFAKARLGACPHRRLEAVA